MSTLQEKLVGQLSGGSVKPLVMGVLNVTPDSFSDGGDFLSLDKAVKRAVQMEEEGADIIDVGGESTGPNSMEVPVEEEIKRVMPVLEMLRSRLGIFLSIDTCKSAVALHALNIGVDAVNDVSAFRGSPEMAQSLAAYDTPVIIMYSKDLTPRTTAQNFKYDDVVKTVKSFLRERIEYGVNEGIARERFIIDPGMGAFISSDSKYSLQILNRLDEFKDFKLPIMVGPSRKSFIGEVLDASVDMRLEGGLASAAISVMKGASIIRTHDVKETRKVVDMAWAILQS